MLIIKRLTCQNNKLAILFISAYARRLIVPLSHQNTMAQTFTNWDEVPDYLRTKINNMLCLYGTAFVEPGFDCSGKKICVYKLASCKVAGNVDYLTVEQKLKIFDIMLDRSVILDNLLHSLSFEVEIIKILDDVFHIPTIVVGTWPHCGLFGGMDETGYIHT